MDEEAPIILPCKHMVCEHCLIDLMEENSKCPTCKREIPTDFDRTKTKGKTRYVDMDLKTIAMVTGKPN